MFGGDLQVFQRRCLGNFERQDRGLQAGKTEAILDIADQVFLLELNGGEIESERHPIERGSRPAADRLERLIENPARQRNDLSSRLGHRNELARRDRAVNRVLPADQRLEPRDRPAGQIHLGLIGQGQVPRGNRERQFPFDQQRPLDLLVEDIVVETENAASSRLRAVERGVHLLDRHLRILAILRGH